MRQEEIQSLLGHARYGHLGLARHGKAYVIPIAFGYDGKNVYFHVERGLKCEYVDDTEEACFQVDHVLDMDQWMSVLAFGPVHEVTNEDERLVAMDALLSAPLPPEWGVSETGEPAHGEPQIMYRLDVTRVTGRKSAHPMAKDSEEEMFV